MKFSDPIECYQAIAQALIAATNQPWSSIKADITLDGDRIDAVVSYVPANGTDPGYLAGVPRLASHFWHLARLLGTEEKGLYKRCHFVLHPTGKFDAQFEY